MITEVFVYGTSPSDVILNGVNKLLPTFHRVSKSNQGVPAHKNWACLTPLSTAGVSENAVSLATASCLLIGLFPELCIYFAFICITFHLHYICISFTFRIAPGIDIFALHFVNISKCQINVK